MNQGKDQNNELFENFKKKLTTYVNLNRIKVSM